MNRAQAVQFLIDNYQPRYSQDSAERVIAQQDHFCERNWLPHETFYTWVSVVNDINHCIGLTVTRNQSVMDYQIEDIKPYYYALANWQSQQQAKSDMFLKTAKESK